MGSVTPAPNSLPYPIGTDKVRDGDNAIEALARRTGVRLGAWTAYSPTVGDANVTVSSGLYLITSDLVQVRMQFTFAAYIGAATQFGLPVPMVTQEGYWSLGVGSGLRQGAHAYYGEVVALNTTTVQVVNPATGAPWGQSNPVVWAAGDVWNLWFSYRNASPI